MERIIETPCGKVRGTGCRLPGVTAYKGIRYATAGRWEYPKLVTGWEGVYDASAYGSCCYQPRSFYDEEYNPKKYFYYNEFRKGASYTYSEDCHFLNIWVPDEAGPQSNLPVLFYIHGGGFTGGCGHEKHFDDPVWPLKGVIAVTVNYRLGPLGFACLPELEEESGHCGNYGLYDQMAALQWVQENISAFGGDPQKVTIMGQSAGGMSVQHICQSPLTDGLFRGAVMSSGCMPGNILLGSKEKSAAYWQEVMKICGCSSLEEFRNVPAEKLFEVWQSSKKDVKGGMMASFPVKDGCFITGGAPKNINYMIGSTSEDMMPPFLYAMGRNWGVKNPVKTYAWFFDRRLPGDENGAWHSSDLWYWFGTLENGWRPWEAKDRQLSETMVSYLCNFVKSGDPNGEGLVCWEPCRKGTKNVLRLGEGPVRMGKASMAKLIKTMLTNKAVGE